MYTEMNGTLNVAFYEANINLYIGKIWSISAANFIHLNHQP